MQKSVLSSILFMMSCIAALGQADPESLVAKGIHTTYVYSQAELINALEARWECASDIFFITYDDEGNVHHYGTMLIEDLLRFMRKEECNLPDYCVVLIDDEAIRRVK